jgi:hypothetical protein
MGRGRIPFSENGVPTGHHITGLLVSARYLQCTGILLHLNHACSVVCVKPKRTSFGEFNNQRVYLGYFHSTATISLDLSRSKSEHEWQEFCFKSLLFRVTGTYVQMISPSLAQRADHATMKYLRLRVILCHWPGIWVGWSFLSHHVRLLNFHGGG